MLSRSSFSLIVPSRQRVKHLTTLLDSLEATAKQPRHIEVVLVVDADDDETLAFTHPGLRIERVVVAPGQTMGALNQKGYLGSTGELVMLLNDDVVARTPGWDEKIRACFADFPDGILLVHVNDTLMRQNLCTFPVLSRTFCQLAGGICPVEYLRYRIDDHIEDVFNLLYALGHQRAIYLPQVVFEHTNSVVMSQGHREYHAEAGLLALDAPLFLTLFETRKELALRLLAHMGSSGVCEQQRRMLAAITDPFTLRIPGRQQVRGKAERLRPSLLQRGLDCWRRRGLWGMTRTIGLRLLAAGQDATGVR